ncbi:MAG: oligosaccharide flippase family protein [Gemmatimonadaceae bacterium]
MTSEITPWAARIAAGGFLRNVLTMAGATAASQLVLVAVAPVVSRLYPPEAWGAYGLLMAFVSVAFVATGLGFDQAIVGARTIDEAASLTVGSLMSAVPISLVSGAVIILLIDRGWFGFGALQYSAGVWCVGLLVATQLVASLRYWHMRSEAFGLLARTTIMQNIARALLPILTSLAIPGWTGLVAAEGSGRLVGLGPLVRHRWSETRELFRRQRWSNIVASFRAYLAFLYAGVPSGLLDALALALPLPLIASKFGAEAAGQFALAQRVIQAPAGLVGRSVADAFHARLAVHARERNAYVPRFFLRTATLLVAVAAIPAVVILLLGPRGFAWIFGAEWLVAGRLVVLLIPWATAQLVVVPLSRAVFVLGGQRQKLVYDVCSVALVLAVYLCAVRDSWDLYQTVWWLVLGQVVAYLIYGLVLWHLVRRRN